MTAGAKQIQLTALVRNVSNWSDSRGTQEDRQVVRKDRPADSKGSIAEVLHIAALLLAIAFFAIAIMGCSSV